MMTDIIQGSPEWAEARRGLVTASEFARTLIRDTSRAPGSWGKGALDFALEIASERMGGTDEEGTSAAMRRGTSHESGALDAYERTLFATVQRGRFLVHDSLPIGFSPDGIVQDREGLGVVEVKCMKLSKHATCFVTGQPPSEHWAQIQGNIWGAGANYCDFVSYHPSTREDMRLCLIRVPRDNSFVSELSLRLIEFCRKVDGFAEKLGCSDWVPYHRRTNPPQLTLA